MKYYQVRYRIIGNAGPGNWFQAGTFLARGPAQAIMRAAMNLRDVVLDLEIVAHIVE